MSDLETDKRAKEVAQKEVSTCLSPPRIASFNCWLASTHTLQVVGKSGLRVVRVQVTSKQGLLSEVDRIRKQKGLGVDFTVLGVVVDRPWAKELLQSVHMPAGEYEVIVVHQEKAKVCKHDDSCLF